MKSKHSSGVHQLQPITALLSTTYNPLAGGGGADKCIDGITNSADGNLCHSQIEAAPWLVLDFGEGAKVSIERVLLYNREDSAAARTKNVEVRLSNELPTSSSSMYSGGFLLGTFQGPAVPSEIVEIKAETWSTWPGHGRYLIVQLNHMNPMNNNDYLNLVEAVAFGVRLYEGKI